MVRCSGMATYCSTSRAVLQPHTITNSSTIVSRRIMRWVLRYFFRARSASKCQ